MTLLEKIQMEEKHI